MKRGLVLALAVIAGLGGLATTSSPAQAEGSPSYTVQLQPGWNLAGWTEPEADIGSLFEAIPAVQAAYAWDAGSQRFLAAFPGQSVGRGSDFETLRPGVGLWLWLGGTEPFVWTRPRPPDPSTAALLLHEGWNLVTWMGFDGVTAEHALAALGSDLNVAMIWDAATGQFLEYSAEATTSTLHRLQRGHPLWVSVAAEREWPQAVPLEPAVVFHGEVSAARKAGARAMVHHLVEHFAERFGMYLSDTTFHLTANDASFREVTARLLGEAPSWICQQYGNGAVFWDLSCDVRRLDPVGRGGRGLGWVYFYALLSHMGNRESFEPWGWTLAGWQRYEFLLYRDSLREEFPTSYRSYEVAIEEFRRRVSHMQHPVERPLHQRGPHSVDLEILGTDWLVRRAGTHSLYEYHQALVRGLRWEDAFTQAFGMTPEVFYDEFEQYIGTIVPPRWYVIGSFLDKDGERLAKWLFQAKAHPATADTEGGSRESHWGLRIYLHPGTYDLEITVRCKGQRIPLGWYDGEGGVTANRTEAGPVLVDGGDVSIEMKLSTLPSEVSPLCELEPRLTIAGVVTGPDGQPVPDLYMRAFRVNYFSLRAHERDQLAEDSTVTADDGRFTLSVLDDYTYWILVNSATCEGGRGELLGAYDSVTGFTHGGTNRYGESTHVVVQGEDVTGIHVPLAAREYDQHLRNRQRCGSSDQTPGQ